MVGPTTRLRIDGIFSCLDTMHECDRQTETEGGTDRQTDAEGHRLTASSALMQRLKINDDGTKVFPKKYFPNSILFYILKILFLSIFIFKILFEHYFILYLKNEHPPTVS